MAAVAGARRTQASYPVYLASTNPTDVELFTEFAPMTNIGYSASIDRAIARVPYVKRSIDVLGFDGNLQPLRPLPQDGAPGEASPAVEGSLNGEYLTDDRVTLLKGRMADPNRDDEFVISSGGAQELGLHIGSTLPLGFYTDTQTESPTFAGYPTDKPYLSVNLKLVGIIEDGVQIVQDDDAALGDQLAVITPALTRRLATCCAYYSEAALVIDGGARHQSSVLSAVEKIVPNLGGAGEPRPTPPSWRRRSAPSGPSRSPSAVFGFIAALAALLICGQVIARMVQSNADDDAGAARARRRSRHDDGRRAHRHPRRGAVGSLLAVAVAVGLSPLAPIGAVRPVYPDPGIAFDWTVLGPASPSWSSC